MFTNIAFYEMLTWPLEELKKRKKDHKSVIFWEKHLLKIKLYLDGLVLHKKSEQTRDSST